MLIKRIKYAGDIFEALVKQCEWDIDTASAFLESIPDAPNASLRPKGEWISVEDRLPEANTQVLAINSDGEFYVATYIEHKISPSARGYMTWASGMYNGKPTHWMPLPEAPKMKGSE